jgi:hypothetical protein
MPLGHEVEVEVFTFESFSLIVERVLGRFLMGQLEIFNFDTIGSEGKRV